jgi:hypothetical protein
MGRQECLTPGMSRLGFYQTPAALSTKLDLLTTRDLTSLDNAGWPGIRIVLRGRRLHWCPCHSPPGFQLVDLL